jgi:hypothetical protein
VSDPDLLISELQGVVPYLGTFLKDLVMLDAASKDELEVSRFFFFVGVYVFVYVCTSMTYRCTSGSGRLLSKKSAARPKQLRARLWSQVLLL